MELQIVVSSLALAFVFMWIQSLYWAMPMRVWVTSALVIGLTTATAMALIVGWAPGLAALARLVIEGVLVAITSVAALMLFFFRDPERIPPEEDGVILSPADGRVIYVKKVEPGSHFVTIKAGTKYPLEELLQNPWPSQGGHLIGIEMNVLDVHVNRAPVAGRVILCKVIKGGYPGLGKPNAEVRSQRAVTLIDDGKISVAVVQIASRFVRGIVSYVKEGQEVALGERIGMIRFGSQVDLAIPDSVAYAVAVEPGQAVKAGQTVLARFGQGLRQESLKGRS